MINNHEYVVYKDMTEEDFDKEYRAVLRNWDSFLKTNGLELEPNKDYFVNRKNLYEVIRRVNKREVYYKIFHNLDKINELKRTAITCYWINTLKPFLVVKEDSDIYFSPNELFSVFMIMGAVRSAFNDVYPNKEFKLPTSECLADMVYNFKYCGLTREATITFVETFADRYGVGIEYILETKKTKES